MAFSMIFTVNFVVFIFVISCTQRYTYAIQDEAYKIHGQSLNTGWDEISMTDHTNERHKRQTTNGSSSQQTTSAPPTPTTTPFNLEDNNLSHDDHDYYLTFVTKVPNLDQYWINLDVRKHDILSDNHRTAVTQDLPFNFPFYGHEIDKVTIATGGFLYMSPFIHQWLTATQYIAPLMANFDTTLGNASEILIALVADEKFVVEWRDVHLQDQNTTGTFQFQAILHKNGSIFFVYKKLPIPVSQISNKHHKVTVGLADAFHVQGTKRRTIFEYHRVSLNVTYIEEGTVAMVHPKPTCNKIKDCETCVTADIGFDCKWCGIIKRCSDSIDWYRQEWINAGCVDLSGSANCSLIPTAAPKKEEPEKSDKGATIGIAIVVSIIVLVLIGSVGGWLYYAYTHPTSASGMWLMEHRPSQMKAKMNNLKFWKRNGASGDKYAVESTA